MTKFRLSQCLAVLAFLWMTSASAQGRVKKAEWQAIRSRITTDLLNMGLTESEVAPIQSPKVKYQGEVIEKKMLSVVRKVTALERHFEDRSIRKSVAFIKEHQTAFEFAQKESGVPAEVVASILLIETQFGTITGRYPTLATLLSLAALRYPDFAAPISKRMKKEALEVAPDAANIDWPARAQKIGDQWMGEVRAFCILSGKLGWKPYRLKGSWAGAVGRAQFMPTTALRNMMEQGPVYWADLWSWDDTIRLVARHLKENGWVEGSAAKQSAAVYGYNAMEAYVTTVLSVADRITQSLADEVRAADRSRAAAMPAAGAEAPPSAPPELKDLFSPKDLQGHP